MVKNNKCLIVIIAFLCFWVNTINAQQQKQLTQNTFNILSYNPAFAGHVEAINVSATLRSQWTGFGKITEKDETTGATTSTSASPTLYMLNGDMYIRAIRGGIGLTISNDQIGLYNNINVNLGYAYQHEFAGGGKLGIGAQVKFDNIVLDTGGLVLGEEGDPLIGQMTSTGNDFIVDCNFGIYYSKPNSFFGGISAINLIESQGYNTLFKEKRSFNVHGGYTFRFPASPKFKITPSALIKTDFATFQVDINAIMTMENKFWFGVNYRISDGLGLIAGLMWKDFRLGYSYDIPMSKLALGNNWGSHEVVFSYSFKFEREKGRLTQKNTRYL
ncbi:type IX secretion system membrane protein PorP/SprF [Bacteroidales bacterium OttesenSCG-928-K03]|nr:type IX secretion system membrane protein PorP/SprF [Odoribacter sp. OttesenSCG-928-L07]MDL2238930.1 type IX secretion system membrane protein PorP/SprF [Bacteroidales bacterium OttesenSCG-928-L14]MDL2242902.1 type IX secretion system membrane protein PorP/SprF [Bacteroidales bacterium OttesenSCG-928-K03]